MYVFFVPVEISDGAIVLTGIEHDEIDKLANRERTPDAQIVIHFDLSDRHPLVVRSYRIHLALVYRNATITKERIFGVVELSGTITVGVVGDLMIIPDWDPGEILVALEEVKISTISRMALAIVVKGENLVVRQGNATKRATVAVVAILVFVDIVPEMNDVVNRVLKSLLARVNTK